MKDGTVVLRITRFEASEQSDVSGGYQCEVNGKGEEIIKALIIMCHANPAMGEVVKYVSTVLKKRETPMMPPKSPYQA